MASHPSPINGAHKGVIFGRERRSARRYGIHTPLSFSLSGSAPGKLTESYEIHNISETGLCVQFSSQMKVTRLLPVCLELSESGARIYAVGHVVWSEPSGKTGVHLPSISDSSRTHLQHWFETNSRAALSAESVIARIPELSFEGSVGPEASSGESSRLQKWAEAEHEIESCGPDFERVLQSIAQQAFALTSASGAAIALMSDSEPAEIVCRARAGTDAPEIGTRIEAGSGFSAECLRSGVTISC